MARTTPHTGQHLAALLKAPGSPLEVTSRPTPTPGPNEVLIEVKSIALNPIDLYQRDYGFPPVAHIPAIVGSDIAGTIFAVGSSVPSSILKVGTRVLAFAASFYQQGEPNYGAFQTHALVPAENVCPIPENLGFNEAAMLPMAVETAWAGFYTIGLERHMKYEKKEGKGMLVWGGASSVGSATVQIAKFMGYTVYTTASEKHHVWLKNLGASRTFDYKSADTVAQILKAAKEDGVTLDVGYDAVGSLKECLEVLNEFKVDGVAKLASAPLVPADGPKMEGVQVGFVQCPEGQEGRKEFFGWVFGAWLKENLAAGRFVPSPKLKVVEGGLEGINKGLDELKGGVSGIKLVLEI